jgi:hypothetical protein
MHHQNQELRMHQLQQQAQFISPQSQVTKEQEQNFARNLAAQLQMHQQQEANLPPSRPPRKTLPSQSTVTSKTPSEKGDDNEEDNEDEAA